MNRCTCLLLLFAAAACPGASQRPQPAPPVAPAPRAEDEPPEDKGQGGIRTQGSELKGGAMEAVVFNGELQSGPAAAAVVAGGAAPPRAFSGSDSDGEPLSITVERVVADPCPSAGGALSLYQVSHGGANPCEGEAVGADRGDRTLSACERAHFDAYTGLAVAIPGNVRDGAYVPSGRRRQFTLSCLTGVLAKCVRWGYRPWEGGPKQELLKACVRAARADYCGTGRSYTCPGARVDIIDRYKIQVREPDPRGQVLEADWGPDGASCLNFARLPGCSAASDQERLRQRILGECQKSRHSLALGACRARCPAADLACGQLIRTWTFKKQGSACDASSICR